MKMAVFALAMGVVVELAVVVIIDDIARRAVINLVECQEGLAWSIWKRSTIS